MVWVAGVLTPGLNPRNLSPPWMPLTTQGGWRQSRHVSPEFCPPQPEDHAGLKHIHTIIGISFVLRSCSCAPPLKCNIIVMPAAEI